MSACGSTRWPGTRRRRKRCADRGQQQDALHPGEGLADAAARARPEREVGEAGPRRLGLGREALGVEAQRIRPEARVAVDDVRARGRARSPCGCRNRPASGRAGRGGPCPRRAGTAASTPPAPSRCSGGRAGPPPSAGRPPSTRSSSSCHRASASGFCARRYHVQVSAFAVVSCPARSRVITSSRSWRSVMRPPSFLVAGEEQHGEQVAAVGGRRAPLRDDPRRRARRAGPPPGRSARCWAGAASG